uniref:Ion transport domain-containing protein n=1 Tax=Parascaris univalens TaxID=6257 RepID=A0A915BGY8_PARUN
MVVGRSGLFAKSRRQSMAPAAFQHLLQSRQSFSKVDEVEGKGGRYRGERRGQKQLHFKTRGSVSKYSSLSTRQRCDCV